MALLTGNPFGTISAQEEIYIESAPQVYFADARVPYMFNPDSEGFYWQLSGSATYPVYQLGCYENVTLGDNLSINEVRCDTVGSKDAILKRNYLELKFNLKSFLPFSVLSALLNGGPVTRNLTTHTEKFGLGLVNNNQYWKVWMPKVYDEVAGDYVGITIHRAKFVTTGEISMTFGNAWSVPVTLRALFSESVPNAQGYATIIRGDFNAI